MGCNRVATLKQTASPFVKYSAGPGRIVACYSTPPTGSSGQSVVDLVSTHSTIELSPQFLQIGIGPPGTRACSEESDPFAKLATRTKSEDPKLRPFFSLFFFYFFSRKFLVVFVFLFQKIVSNMYD